MAWRIVIAGGGFGGFYAARALERRLPASSARVTLVNDVNFLLYTPLLPGASGGTLEPRHVVVPLREALTRTDIRIGQVQGADPQRKVVEVRTLEGHREELPYDQLVIALGSVSRTLPVPGLAEHAIGYKTLSEAIALRNRVIAALESAETLEDPAEREAWLTFVFVGGGYAGVEGLAELQDFAADAIERYPRCRTQGMRWILVEGRDRIMGEISPALSEWCMRELRSRGIEIRTGTTVDAVGAASVRLSDGEEVPSRLVCWTAGVKAHPVVERLGVPLQDGRVRTDERMQVPGVDGVWAIGDAAAVPDPATGGRRPCPPTAQHALRQGRLVARNVAAALGTGTARRFTYKTLGVFVDLGRHKAVASTLGIRWRGLPAWWLARSYHLAAMPGAGRRARLLVDWNVGLLFGRDTVELGQLGHPVPLSEQSAGGTAPDGTPTGTGTVTDGPDRAPAVLHS